MIAALLALVCLQEGRLAPAELKVTGPIERLVLDCGSRGQVELRLRLLDGESRTLRVPLPGRPMDDAPPRVEVGGGSVDFLGYLEQPGPGLAALSPELLRRPRPPVTPHASVLDPVALLLLAAGAVAVLAARRSERIELHLGLGLCAGGLVLTAQLRGAPPTPDAVLVLEGALDQAAGAPARQAWMLVEGAADALVVDPDTDLLVEVRPERAPLTYVGDGQGAWTVRGPKLWRLAPLDPGGRRLDGRLNLWGELERTWTRTPSGAWTGRGEWSMGTSLPGGEVEGQPPGWLAAGIPPGRSALVARLAPDSWSGGGRPENVPDVVWLRLVGFDFAGAR